MFVDIMSAFFPEKRQPVRRALLIGTDHPDGPLPGVPNDIRDMANDLVAHGIFRASEIRTLTGKRATTNAIRKRIQQFVKDLQDGDKWFFYWSGHGTQLPARNEEGELDGLIGGLVPYDYDGTRESMITDKELCEIFAKTPKGSGYAMFDCCHAEEFKRSLGMGIRNRYFHNSEMSFDFAWRQRGLTELKKDQVTSFNTDKVTCLTLVACEEQQTAADASFGGRPNGALTRMFLDTPNRYEVPASQLLVTIRTNLNREGFEQRPSFLHNLKKLDQPFLS